MVDVMYLNYCKICVYENIVILKFEVVGVGGCSFWLFEFEDE